MSVEIHGDVLGVDEALQELDRLKAADAAEAAAAGAKPDEERVPEEPAEHAAGAERTESTQSPDGKVPADKPDEKPKGEASAQATDPKDGKPASRYEKAQERQKRSWDELNAQKDAHRKEREAFEADRRKFEAERSEHQAQREKAEGQFTPEQYEQAAKDFEAAGKFDLADLARRKAQDVRRNPPAQRPAAAQQQQQREAQSKEWALKAGVDFPELARNNSPLQVRVAQLLKEEPDLQAHPKGIYVAARLADLEARAAKAAGAEQELGNPRAKVKELEELTTPSGEGGAMRLPAAKTFEQLSDVEQFAELERQAREVGVLTG